MYSGPSDFTSASWIRDSSFTLYALIRLGFTEEANCKFVFRQFYSHNLIRYQHISSSYLNVCGTRIPMGVCRSCIPSTVRLILLPLILSNSPSTGGKDLEEVELPHLDGHKGSRPVRIGNGAADHIQLVSDERAPYVSPSQIHALCLIGYLR